MAVPSVERPPGVCAPWVDVWRAALRVLKDRGVWAPELKPLLDEYVFALFEAAEARVRGEHVVWDRHVKRAVALADQLCLSPRGRRQAGLPVVEGDEDSVGDPFEVLDELDSRRQRRAS